MLYGLYGFRFLFYRHIYRLSGKMNIAAYIYYSIFLFFTIIGASSSLDNVIVFF